MFKIVEFKMNRMFPAFTKKFSLFAGMGIVILGMGVTIALGEPEEVNHITKSPTEELNSIRSTKKASSAAVERDAMLLREGFYLQDIVGSFEVSGDTAMFVEKNGRKLGTLKNLNLQRINEVLGAKQEPEKLVWRVSGVVTEFGGQNFILLSKAVQKTAGAE